ncbi:hypothetical protein V6N13_070753 [Hibiscus sabdariffa]|uniref:Uncharacterized protein n=1 Tax=Hibiscus sabdariffa TaxID=183260 RepID=A0ABR2TFY0_9ROSI
MEQSKTVAESSSKQPPAEESNQKASDPAMDAEGFVIVSTAEPEIEEKQTQNPGESQIQTERVQSPNQTSSGSRKSVHWSPELVSESPVADHGVTRSAPKGSNPYIAAHDPAPESISTSFKGKQLHIYSDFHYILF